MHPALAAVRFYEQIIKYMKTKTIILIGVITMARLPAEVAWGDLAPYPVHRQPRPSEPSEPVLDLKSTTVTMQEAHVDIILKQQSPNRILARVNGLFRMSFAEVKRASVDFMMALPVVQTNAADVASFRLLKLEIDGTPIKKFRQEAWDEYQGFVWPIRLYANTNQTVSVSYEVLLSVRDNKSSFTYILKSGAKWSGPIDHETIRIKADKGIGLSPTKSLTLEPNHEAAGSIVWEIKNAVPTEDVSVGIFVNPAEK
jgi:hypothetical protein